MLRKLLLSALGLTLGLLLAGGGLGLYRWLRPAPRAIRADDQAAIRTLLDQNPKSLYCFDAATSYRLKPGFRAVRWQGVKPEQPWVHETNSLGLMSATEPAPDPRVKKVLFLGDSVCYGDSVPLEATFVERMQPQAGRDCQLFNAGCPGYSTHQEFALFETRLSSVAWSAVVVVFCLNDLVRFEWVYDAASGGFRMSEEMQQVGGLTELSTTAEALRLRGLRQRFLDADSLKPLAEQNNTTLYAWDEAKWQTYIDETLRPFIARQRGLRLAFVLAPSREQLEALARGGAEELVLYPQRRLTAFCAAEHVGVIDLTPTFAAPAAEPLLIDSLHFSPAGHARAAERIWPELQQLLAR